MFVEYKIAKYTVWYMFDQNGSTQFANCGHKHKNENSCQRCLVTIKRIQEKYDLYKPFVGYAK